MEECKKLDLVELPSQHKEEKLLQNFHSSNSISMNGMKTINTLTRGYQATGECSTSFTIEPARHQKRLQPTHKLDQAFLGLNASASKGTENLTLSSAGVLFAAGPLSGYINLPTKGTMYQSFNTNKPTLPSGLCSNTKQVTDGSSSITIKKFSEDSADCSGILKIRKKNIVPLSQSPDLIAHLQSKLHIILQDEGDGKRVFKRLKVRKAQL